MRFAGYLQTSLIEWPGKISAVVFTPGCNFRCPYCHNRDLVGTTNNDQDIRQEVGEDEILQDLKKRKKWIDGVCVTGGEPTLWGDELVTWLVKVKQLGMEVMMETNASKPDMVNKLIQARVVDCWATDYKVVPRGYAEVVRPLVARGLAQKVQQSWQMMLASGQVVEFRTTLVPGIHDREKVKEMAEWLVKFAGKDRANVSWVLQKFLPQNCLDPICMKLNPFSEEKMQGFLELAAKSVPWVHLR